MDLDHASPDWLDHVCPVPNEELERMFPPGQPVEGLAALLNALERKLMDSLQIPAAILEGRNA